MITTTELDDVIEMAIKKIHGKKENELCKYLPISSGGYMHHFTFRKTKHKNPEELIDSIKEFVINKENPEIVAPKKRAARGSRKKRDQLIFSKYQLERMLNIARLAGDKEIINILSPKKSLANCKKDLIYSIRQNKVDQELWNSYMECISAMNPSLENQTANS